MIRNITAGPGLCIAANSYSTPYVDMTRPSAGMIRYNGGSMEVYDGSNWLLMSSGIPQIELDGVTQEAVRWAYSKMNEEARVKELAAKHPAVADALAAVAHAQEQLDVVTILVQK
jgi:hypothetical protein